MNTAAMLHLLLTYRYFILFPLTVIEGPLVTLAAGFLISMNLINPIIALPLIVAGDVTGDIFYYYLGRFGYHWSVGRWLIKKLRFDRHEERVVRSFSDHGGRNLLIGKLTHAFGAFFLIGAGYARMRLWLFIWYNTVGTVIKSSALLFIGYLAGAAYVQFYRYFEYGSLIVSIAAVALVVVFYYFHDMLMGIHKEEEHIEE